MNYTPEEIELLRQGAAASQAGQPTYGVQANLANLLAAGHVEVNPAMVDAVGKVAFRASPAGVAHLATLPPAPPAAAAAAAAWGADKAPVAPKAAPAAGGGFAIGSGFVVPVKGSRRPAGTGRTYPFENMELYSHIFVPATDKRPDPKKSLASTISSANKRFATFEPRRYFRTFRAVAGQTFGEGIIAPTNGAYIVRVDPPAAGAVESAE